MKIGIVTYVKDDNYGEELQAFAMQHYLNDNGYNAEVIDLEKRVKDLSKSKDAIIPAIVNRFKILGWKAPWSIMRKIFSVIKKRKHDKDLAEYKTALHQAFVDFFNRYTRHSDSYYTLEEIRTTDDLPYDTYIAGSDQIWNYMHTDFLDVFFLEFSKKYNARRISYAASVSVPDIPDDKKGVYRQLCENIEFLSVRELSGAQLIESVCGRKAEVVLDPTLLLNKSQWNELFPPKLSLGENYVMVYTLSGSRYIRKLASYISKHLNCEKIVFVISNETLISKDGHEERIVVDPADWVALMLGAKYVVTDSFHGTAFSINFNKPFTTLVNPVSNMNSRVLSILKITELESRIIYDDGKCAIPDSLNVDYTVVNKIVDEWRHKSKKFLTTALES